LLAPARRSVCRVLLAAGRAGPSQLAPQMLVLLLELPQPTLALLEHVSLDGAGRGLRARGERRRLPLGQGLLGAQLARLAAQPLQLVAQVLAALALALQAPVGLLERLLRAGVQEGRLRPHLGG